MYFDIESELHNASLIDYKSINFNKLIKIRNKHKQYKYNKFGGVPTNLELKKIELINLEKELAILDEEHSTLQLSFNLNERKLLVPSDFLVPSVFNDTELSDKEFTSLYEEFTTSLTKDNKLLKSNIEDNNIKITDINDKVSKLDCYIFSQLPYEERKIINRQYLDLHFILNKKGNSLMNDWKTQTDKYDSQSKEVSDLRDNKKKIESELKTMLRTKSPKIELVKKQLEDLNSEIVKKKQYF